MRRVFFYAQMLAGGLLAYVAVGGGIGFLIRSAFADGSSCTPYNGAGGVIVSHCDHIWINLIWVVTLSVPRLAVLFPAIGAALLWAGARQGDAHVAANSLPFLAISIPLIVVAWLGSRYWLRRDRAVGWGMLILIVVEIGALAVMV